MCIMDIVYNVMTFDCLHNCDRFACTLFDGYYSMCCIMYDISYDMMLSGNY